MRAATARRGARDAVAPADDGAAEAGPERFGARAHGVEGATANLTGDGADRERRRAGGATANGGCGRRATPAAL